MIVFLLVSVNFSKDLYQLKTQSQRMSITVQDNLDCLSLFLILSGVSCLVMTVLNGTPATIQCNLVCLLQSDELRILLLNFCQAELLPR